jgi:hypothetical protein
MAAFIKAEQLFTSITVNVRWSGMPCRSSLNSQKFNRSYEYRIDCLTWYLFDTMLYSNNTVLVRSRVAGNKQMMTRHACTVQTDARLNQWVCVLWSEQLMSTSQTKGTYRSIASFCEISEKIVCIIHGMKLLSFSFFSQVDYMYRYTTIMLEVT